MLILLFSNEGLESTLPEGIPDEEASDHAKLLANTAISKAVIKVAARALREPTDDRTCRTDRYFHLDCMPTSLSSPVVIDVFLVAFDMQYASARRPVTGSRRSLQARNAMWEQNPSMSR